MEETDEFVPRAYQIDLYEHAVERNTIIYLPTGSGKTYIAVMLIMKLSKDIQKPYSEGGKHTIFIVNTVPLVKQQSKYIARITGLPCGAYSGDMLVDFWSESEWSKELEENRILVMTAQICVNMLSHGYLKLNRVNLILCDECHRGVSNHPMRQIMQHFEYCPKEEQPRILALSATLLNSNVQVKSVAENIRTLEVTYHSKIATVNSASHIKNYCTCPKEKFVTFEPYLSGDVGKRVEKILDDMETVLKAVPLNNPLLVNESSDVFKPITKNSKLNKFLLDVKAQFNCTGVYGANKAVLLRLIQLECLKKYADDINFVHILEYLITGFTKIRKILDDEMKDIPELERIHKFSSDHVRKLLAILKTFYDTESNDQKFYCIVFVQRRFTAKVLYHVLKNLHQHDENYKFLTPDFMVGFTNNPYQNSKEVLCMSKWNHEVLYRFRNGLSNCIIATDVIDEGIDIPLCCLVIRYDLPVDFRSYVQSKGRARSATSQYIMLLPANDNTFLKKYQNFKDVESHLERILIGRTDLRSEPAEKEIKEKLYKTDIEPYIVQHNDDTKSVLTENFAISLINKYCTALLKSKFVVLSPTWILHTDDTKKERYQVSLQLPILSPLKGVVLGDPMASIDSAKRSAAMKTCIRLHELGELTDKLLPNTVESVMQDVTYLFPHWEDEEKSESAMPGTYKKKRKHKLNFPSALYGAFPQVDETLYLHILHAKPTYTPQLDNRNLVFHNLLCDKAGFGILSAKKMPQVPSFPIFMNVGELSVTIEINRSTPKLSRPEIEELRLFHSMLFRHIVPVIKSFMVFDLGNLDNSFLVVPVNEACEINWDIINEYKSIELIKPSIPLRFKNSDYDLALVTPSYRAAVSEYIVTQVCDDRTPESCFPSDEFYSYVHYYKEKHGVSIHDTKQPMLEVKPISKKINCIKHREVKPGLSKRKRADILEDFEEHLIPELCLKINFPALYWLKATTLPSILHRVSQLLIAEDLRTTIANEAGLGILELPEQERWPSLVISHQEKEEYPKLVPEIPFDESVEGTQPEPELSGPEVDVLNTDANRYPWSKDQEPPDLERNIEQIQVIDIECYCHFMSMKTDVGTTAMRDEKITFMSKPSVPVPNLKTLSQKDDRGPDPVQIMYALTTVLGNDEFNLERLETLGDSYLKFIVSAFLYYNFPNYNEGRLTALKGRIIGNRYLYYCGKHRDIPGRMKVDDFIPMSNFIAPCYTAFRPLQQILLDVEVSPSVLYEICIPTKESLEGCISEITKDMMQEKVLNWHAAETQTGLEHFLGVQTVSDKSVADSVEALIGVYLTSMGVETAVTLLKWFDILPATLNAHDLLHNVPKNVQIMNGDVNVHMPWASNIEERIGYKFKNRVYMLQAFTHPSYTGNRLTDCYQRLEFLGDAIIDFLITCHIYETCENITPGALTDLRSALVNNIVFACLSVRYALHTALLAYTPKLNDAIDRFVKFQVERNHVVGDELLWVLLEEGECNIVEYVDVPKVLGDLFESIIGAIYLDSGKNLLLVWEILYSLMHKEINEFRNNIPKQPVRVLYETQGARPVFSPAVSVEGTDNVMVPLKVFIAGKVKLFHGFGANKKQAKRAAAKQALKSILYKT